MNMTIGSLFSGIGGLELGLERAGIGEVAWQVEINAHCRSVLAKHWPKAKQYDDVRTVGASTLSSVGVICGGFPCTDISQAGKRTGLGGDQSGLWVEFRRIISELRPAVVVAENSGNAWRDWVPSVRRDLFGLGYSSLPIRMRAHHLGANHGRDRAFVVAYSNESSKPTNASYAEMARVCSDARRFTSVWGWCSVGDFSEDDGVSDGMDATRAYGNAVMPQMSEVIGDIIVSLGLAV